MGDFGAVGCSRKGTRVSARGPVCVGEGSRGWVTHQASQRQFQAQIHNRLLCLAQSKVVSEGSGTEGPAEELQMCDVSGPVIISSGMGMAVAPPGSGPGMVSPKACLHPGWLGHGGLGVRLQPLGSQQPPLPHQVALKAIILFADGGSQSRSSGCFIVASIACSSYKCSGGGSQTMAREASAGQQQSRSSGASGKSSGGIVPTSASLPALDRGIGPGILFSWSSSLCLDVGRGNG